jgi:hypothetical protein
MLAPLSATNGGYCRSDALGSRVRQRGSIGARDGAGGIGMGLRAGPWGGGTRFS